MLQYPVYLGVSISRLSTGRLNDREHVPQLRYQIHLMVDLDILMEAIRMVLTFIRSQIAPALLPNVMLRSRVLQGFFSCLAADHCHVPRSTIPSAFRYCCSARSSYVSVQKLGSCTLTARMFVMIKATGTCTPKHFNHMKCTIDPDYSSSDQNLEILSRDNNNPGLSAAVLE
jgi:hypothetical protein